MDINKYVKNIKEKLEDIIKDIDTFFYKLSKLPKKFIKMIDWIIFLWKDEDWDYRYLLNIIQKKLYYMQKTIEENSFIKDNKKVSRQMRIVIEHIKRFNDIDEYTIPVGDYDVWFEDVTTEEKKDLFDVEAIDDEDGTGEFCTMKDNMTKYQNYILTKHQPSLENWHWKQIWKNISRNGRRWLD